jgi:DNA polymerase elongation subunit (family B)
MRDKNKDGSLGELKILKRGIIVARRDTAKIVHKTYNKLLHMALTKQPVYDAFNLIMNTINDLVNDRLSARQDLTVIRALGDNYKSDSYFMKVFGDELIRVGRPANASDRLDYIIVKTKAEEEGEKNVKLGLKMRLIDMYEDSMGIERNDKSAKAKSTIDSSLILCENDPLNQEKESVAVYPPEKIDYEYYIGHILMAPIDQLFCIGYMKDLERFKDVCYKPQFCRIKPASMIEPIQMITKILIDYGKKGFTMDQCRTLIEQVQENYGNLLRENV